MRAEPRMLSHRHACAAVLLCAVAALAGCATGEPTTLRPVDAQWSAVDGQWTVTPDGITGEGNMGAWAIARSTATLPAAYRLDADVTVRSDSVAELMLNWRGEHYLRLYPYVIEKNVHLGDGEYRNDPAKGLYGSSRIYGPTLGTFDVPGLDVGRTVHLSVTFRCGRVQVDVNGQHAFDQAWTRNTFGSTRLGLTANGRASFDHIRIEPLGGSCTSGAG